MGTIRPLKKWDLERDTWRAAETDKDFKRALSIATYGNIIHKENEPLNYILIADGCRVENHSKDSKTIKERQAGIKNVISYFEERQENYCIELLLVDNDAPLSEESKAFAKYIETLASFGDIKTINYVGFSKCGVIGLDMIKHLKTNRALSKTRIYSVSSPYEGTIIASPKALIMEVRKIITAKLGDNEFSKKVADALEKKYRSVLSNSHMDLDIAVNGGVPDEMMALYDPKFLQDIFSKENMDAIQKVRHYQNICTRIDDTTLKSAIMSGNFLSLGLCIVNDVLFDGNSDGVVPYTSQSAIEGHLEDSQSSIIIPSTHNSLSIPKYANQILDVVNSNREDKRISLHR